jgi:hypothetical protein
MLSKESFYVQTTVCLFYKLPSLPRFLFLLNILLSCGMLCHLVWYIITYVLENPAHYILKVEDLCHVRRITDFTEVLKQGQEGLQDTVRQLECDQKETLLKCATVWNCNSKNCHPAQVSLVGSCSVLNKTLEQTF